MAIETAERQTIIDEIYGHLSISERHSNLETTLKNFGTPHTLAKQYMKEFAKVSIYNTPLRPLIALMKISKNNFSATLLLIIYFILYFGSFIFFIIGILKLLLPTQIGLYETQNSYNLFKGCLSCLGEHDQLGYWLLPFTLLLGSSIFSLTDLACRQTVQAFLNKEQY